MWALMAVLSADSGITIAVGLQVPVDCGKCAKDHGDNAQYIGVW